MTVDEAWLVLRRPPNFEQQSKEEQEQYLQARAAWRQYVNQAMRASGRGASPELHVLDTLAHQGRLGEVCDATVERLLKDRDGEGRG